MESHLARPRPSEELERKYEEDGTEMKVEASLGGQVCVAWSFLRIVYRANEARHPGVSMIVQRPLNDHTLRPADLPYPLDIR